MRNVCDKIREGSRAVFRIRFRLNSSDYVMYICACCVFEMVDGFLPEKACSLHCNRSGVRVILNTSVAVV